MNIVKHFAPIAVAAVFFVSSSVAIAAGVTNQTALSHIPVCGAASPDTVRCHARVVADANGNPIANITPAGYNPSQFRVAYGVGGASGLTTTTIAVVDAYDDS